MESTSAMAFKPNNNAKVNSEGAHSVPSDSSARRTEHKKDIARQLKAMVMAKKKMRFRRDSLLLDHSQVKTPAVLSYMMGRHVECDDDPGLEMYGKSESNTDVLASGIIDSWCKSFDIEQSSYESVSLFAEVRLKEALAATEEIDKDSVHVSQDVGQYRGPGVGSGREQHQQHRKHQIPSQLRIAMCSDLIRKTSRMFGRYQSLMTTLTDEMLRCIYYDYDSVIKGADYIDARTFYNCTPYFEELKNCRIHRDELQEELAMYNDGIDLRKAISK